MEYQTIRGGRVVLQNITKPTFTEWGSPLEALTAVFEMEKTVSRSQRKKELNEIKKRSYIVR